MPSQTIAVFARAPQPGHVKTRLAARFGEEAATQLYVAMLRDCLAIAQSAAQRLGDCEVCVAFTPDDAFAPGPHSLSPLWNSGRLPQDAGHLGVKMRHVFAQLFEGGMQSAVFIGSDSPDLPADFIVQAFMTLKESDLVFGPARDGGFYLIGANATPPAELFESVDWSAPVTLERTLANARRLDFSCVMLPAWDDVDEPDDVTSLVRRLERSKAAPASWELLRGNSLI